MINKLMLNNRMDWKLSIRSKKSRNCNMKKSRKNRILPQLFENQEGRCSVGLYTMIMLF